MTEVLLPPPVAVNQLSDLIALVKNVDHLSAIVEALKVESDKADTAKMELVEATRVNTALLEKLAKQETSTDNKLQKLANAQAAQQIQTQETNNAYAQLAEDKADFDKIRAKVEAQLAADTRELEALKAELEKTKAALAKDQAVVEELRTQLVAKQTALADALGIK